MATENSLDLPRYVPVPSTTSWPSTDLSFQENKTYKSFHKSHCREPLKSRNKLGNKASGRFLARLTMTAIDLVSDIHRKTIVSV